ncbi:MAG: DNA internalization-related competence protein ComEC/Rec2 [Dehalococcoidia bacterium]|nr:DNA internalization-related competence protein ComEC/Rec2 [Dehalococcoidia bacterium]
MVLGTIALAWLGGVVGVVLWGAPAWLPGLWAVLLTPVAVRRAGVRRGGFLAVVAIVSSLGGGYRMEGWLERPPPGLASLASRQVTIEGRIAGGPQRGLTTRRYRVEVEAVVRGAERERTEGAVLVTLDQYADHLPGERVRASGLLEEAPVFPEFDYRAYLARQGIVGTMFRPQVAVLAEAPLLTPSRLVEEGRRRLERSLERSLPEPEASLAAGIGFGQDGGLPDDLYEEFRAAGLAHIVAVSGSNVALLAALAFAAGTPIVGRRRAALPAAVMVGAYVLLAGASPSVVRAGIMAWVYLLAMVTGRQQNALPALGLAAVVMTALHPGAALDVGFQLSFAATAGLVAFGPWVRRGLEWLVGRLGLAGLVPSLGVQAMALALSASLATLPLVWVNFGRVSLAGPIANVVVEPLFVLTLPLVLLTGIAGMAWAPAGWALGLVAYYPLAFITWFAGVMTAVPGASAPLPEIDGEAALGMVLLLSLAAWPAYRYFPPPVPGQQSGPRRRVAGRALGGAVAGAALGCMLFVGLRPVGGPGELVMTVLDVGQGDAILLTTPGGRQVLVDSGPSGLALARELGAVLPGWERSVEVALTSHPQQDHIGGLPELLRRYEVAETADAGAASGILAYRLSRAEAGEGRRLARGDRWEEDGVLFEVLWPPTDYVTRQMNDLSLVLRVRYGETVFLLTGDIQAAAQRALMKVEEVRADVLKVPHHGSTSSAPEFLEAVGAEVAVVSVGDGNPFGHPSRATLSALGGAEILRTDSDGRVRVRSDGKRLVVETER